MWEAPCWSLSTLSLTGSMTFSRWERKMVRYATTYRNISGISGYLEVRIRMEGYYPLSTWGVSRIHSRQSNSTSFDCSFLVRIPYTYSLLVGGGTPIFISLPISLAQQLKQPGDGARCSGFQRQSCRTWMPSF